MHVFIEPSDSTINPTWRIWEKYFKSEAPLKSPVKPYSIYFNTNTFDFSSINKSTSKFKANPDSFSNSSL